MDMNLRLVSGVMSLTCIDYRAFTFLERKIPAWLGWAYHISYILIDIIYVSSKVFLTFREGWCSRKFD